MSAVFCIGHAVQDFVFSVTEMPASAEKYRANGFSSMGGGPAATAAVAISQLGGYASLASRLGDDSIADIIVSELQHYGVDCTHVTRFKGRQSSLSSVTLDANGERQIVNYLDPEIPSDASSLPDDLPEGTRAVLVDTRWPDGALAGMELARKAGVPGIVDADLPVPADGNLLAAASHIAFSEPGLAEFTSLSDPREALGKVHEQTGAWCCVTLGSKGTISLGDGPMVTVGAFKVDVVDTLGAGDVWHGAFALALAEGKSTADALTFATAAAAIKVSRPGGRHGAPTRADVDEFLKQKMEDIA